MEISPLFFVTSTGRIPEAVSTRNWYLPPFVMFIPPSSAREWKPAIVACPQRGTSVVGVNHRIRRSASGLVGGRMNAVSERFISLAIPCISRSLKLPPSGTTPAGLPVCGVVVNASTCLILILAIGPRSLTEIECLQDPFVLDGIHKVADTEERIRNYVLHPFIQ